MMNRKQMCACLIEQYAQKNNIKLDEINSSHIYQSSTVGVCLEYLGLLKTKEEKDYVASREGIVFTYLNRNTGDLQTLGARELIGLLPEE